MRSWLSVFFADTKSKKGSRHTDCSTIIQLSNKMDNSLLVVRDINHKYIVVEGGKEVERFLSEFKKADNFKKDYGNIYKELGITARELYSIEKISILKNETIIKYEKKEISDLKEYKKIKKKIFTDFKKTNYWKTIEKAIDRTFDLLQKNPKPTLAEIKEANLDVYKSPYKD